MSGSSVGRRGIRQKQLRHRMWLLLSLIFAPVIAEGRSSSEQEPSVQEYVGCFELGFEADFFFPKGGKMYEVWSLDAYPESFFEQIQAFPPDKNGYRHVYARVLGTTVKKSKQMYARAISVQSVIQLRNHLKSDGICRLVPPAL